MKAHCLFEQSGTFKNEFIKLGIPAEDYDIQNEFGETDHVVDLFAEIDDAYDGFDSIFDGMDKEDIIFAFFPCTRFQECNSLLLRGEKWQQKGWMDTKKLEYSMKLHDELHLMYGKLSKLFAVCLRRGLRLVVENPYTQPHYLTMYFPIKPRIIDTDRRQNGDYFKKPTQYWFVNMEPKDNIVLEPIEYVESQIVETANVKKELSRQTNRSMIHPQYARRFILQHILEETQ